MLQAKRTKLEDHEKSVILRQSSCNIRRKDNGKENNEGFAFKKKK